MYFSDLKANLSYLNNFGDERIYDYERKHDDFY
jgi:hypothetical protein